MWILESIIMKMKSARLYDYTRDNEILALPSKSMLKQKMNRLISVTTSRFTAEALRPNSSSRAVIASFLGYLAARESHADGAGGFLSEQDQIRARLAVMEQAERESDAPPSPPLFILPLTTMEDFEAAESRL
ncbi:unnamed protein product, partial [Ixodes pacificus]